MNKILTDTEARDALKRGIDVLANAVKATLGPRGRNVVIWKNHIKIVTKDGVTVASQLFLDDKFENAGADMIRQAAFSTGTMAGDGTTTSIVLAQAIVTAGLEYLAGGANPVDLKKGIDYAVEQIVMHLKGQAEQVTGNFDRIRQVGTISANGDESIGNLIAEAMEKVGEDGVIYLDEWRKSTTKVEYLDGMQIQAGWIDQNFVNNMGKLSCEFTHPMIFVYDDKIHSIAQLIPVLDHCATNKIPLVMIADGFDSETLASLVTNKNTGQLLSCCIKAPIGDNSKDILRDIAKYNGAKYVSEDDGIKLEFLDETCLGTCARVIITKQYTTFVDGGAEDYELNEYIADLKEQVENLADEYGKDGLKDRIAKLIGGVGVIYVGAPTDVELREKKDRVDDALHATRAAVAEGIVPGGGVAYLRTLDTYKQPEDANVDIAHGIAIVRKALSIPLMQICENSALNAKSIVSKVKEMTGPMGYNAAMDTFEDLMAAGIVDPVKVSRVALENAASVAGMILTTSSVIID